MKRFGANSNSSYFIGISYKYQVYDFSKYRLSMVHKSIEINVAKVC